MGLVLYFLSDPKSVYDGTGAVKEEAKVIRSHIPIRNVIEIVAHTAVQCGYQKQLVSHLIISGHGTRYRMNFGNDKIGLDNISLFEPQLRKLKPYLLKDATVTLWGCNAGVNVALLMTLSMILGARVQGATEDISVGTWGPFGYMSESEMNVCILAQCSAGDSYTPAVTMWKAGKL
ncbi:DUF4347 domain-containing protein [Bosea sp. 124]|uniref:DUF4347 domain-containing protein n=1 Tax=Bosea sp. 124 TaxID=2135642 RepID=UPI000D3990D0|nr:DUF4347 domain-containing protein [Bosea sp. 124]PTM40947.1 uncharacterized protein DUF4347 [Bosea sp. 124]